jgi:putative endopeptidase
MSKFEMRSLPVVTTIVLLSINLAGQDTRFSPQRMDTTCKPCEDFYQFVNGNWLKDNPIPAAFPTWGTFSILQQDNRKVLREILEDAGRGGPTASDAAKITGTFYASCMDESRIEVRGIAPIADELSRIDAIKDIQGLRAEMARLHGSGVPAVFQFFSAADRQDSSKTMVVISQGGLSLPNKDYYTKTDEKSKQTRSDFAKHVGRMFELLGHVPERASREAGIVMKIQTELADGSMDPVEGRDPFATTNKRSLTQLQQMTPAFLWREYLTARSVPSFSELNIGQPKFFEKLNRMFTEVSVEEWQVYLRWQVLNSAAPRLSSKFQEENFNFFNRTLNGTPEMQPRWQRCVVATDASLGEALGQAFVEKRFPPESKARMAVLVDNLTKSFRERIQTRDWMSEDTKKQALKKLDAITRSIGYPDQWKDYTSLRLTRDSYFENTAQAAALEIRRNLDKIEKPNDRAEWRDGTPATVNAYYGPANNVIVFPAGILQPPFFDPQADDALNYGAIGALIGHEMTHAFDDRGSQFDASGNLQNWWTPDDRNKFSSRAECVSEQFSGYKTSDGMPLNGKLVLSESIADLGGITMAYYALQKSMAGKPRPANIDGFTPEQRFFIGYAIIWASNQRPEAERRQALTDTHALARYRINGPLSNLKEFATAFACNATDAMVRQANRQCQVW